MTIAELLRKLADTVAAYEDPGAPDEKLQNPAELEPINVGVEVKPVDNVDAGANDEIMVPPLQQKIELLKKAVGVDNIYDEQEECDPLSQLRKNAGIVVVDSLADDEPLDS